jgi:hypothetical protein
MKAIRLLCAALVIALATTLGCGTAQLQAPSYHLATTVTSVPENWVRVSTLSGAAHNVGEPFTLEGHRVRLAYTVTGNGTAAHPEVSAYVVQEGKYLNRDGGVPDVIDVSGSGEIVTIKAPGNYYLDVAAVGCTWEIMVYEWR